MRRTYDIALWTLTVAVAAWALIRLTGQEPTWYGVTLISFTPWVALGALVPVIAALSTKRWWAAGVAGAALLTLAVLVVPRAFGGPDPGPGPRLVVMSANLRVGQADVATELALARDHHVDVLALQEYTPEIAARFAAAGIDALFPYSTTAPYEYAVGVAIFSRYPLRDVGHIDLPGGFGEQFATVDVPGAPPLLVNSVHTRPPAIPESVGDWTHGLREQPGATPHGPVRLLVGDFNATLDHRELRTLIDTGYRDIADALGDALVSTWPYAGSPLPGITLDHMLADPRVGAVSFGAYEVTGTDHRAIIATVTLPAG